jgi:hypothetical protein
MYVYYLRRDYFQFGSGKKEIPSRVLLMSGARIEAELGEFGAE